MKAEVIKFPNRFLPATRQDRPCIIVVMPVVRIERECPKIVELRLQSKLLREHFKPKCGM